jgi:hypothetical protein
MAAWQTAETDHQDGLLLRRRLIPQCPARHARHPHHRGDRLSVALGCSGIGPARVRNVSLSKRLTPRGNKEKATLWTPNPRNKNRKLCRQRP